MAIKKMFQNFRTVLQARREGAVVMHTGPLIVLEDGTLTAPVLEKRFSTLGLEMIDQVIEEANAVEPISMDDLVQASSHVDHIVEAPVPELLPRSIVVDGVQFSQDMTFWYSCLKTRCKNFAEAATFEEFVARKGEFPRGYMKLTLTATGDVGIAHVTRQGVAAVFADLETGQFHAKANNNRFNGETIIDAERAKAFLNGH